MAAQQDDSDADLVKAWAFPANVILPKLPARTRAIPPSPSRSAQEVQSKSKPRPRPLKGKGKANPPGEVKNGAPFESECEESERQAANASPVKGKGNRLTSMAIVQVEDVDVATPRPAKVKVKVEPGTPDVIVIDESPRRKTQTGPRGPTSKKGKATPTPDLSDDEHGRKAAKGGDARGSSARSVKVEAVDSSDDDIKGGKVPFLKVPAGKKRSGSVSSNASSTSGKKYKYKDLPGGARIQDLWVKSFIPTMIKYQGTRAQPWTFEDHEAVDVVQKIWDALFAQEQPWAVALGDPVHSLAIRCLYDWRSKIGDTGMRVVESYFNSFTKYKSKEARAEFSKRILQDDCFVYLNHVANDGVGLLKSPFLLRVLAVHLEDTAGAVAVPGLYRSEDEAQFPRGAIGLCAASVGRAFKLWAHDKMEFDDNGVPYRKKEINPSTGIYSNHKTAFSEQACAEDTEDFSDVAGGLEPKRKELLLEAARALLGHSANNGDHQPGRSTASRKERRKLMVDKPE
ncbi:hypothetical protein OH77DRAFT_1427959 [Trametes cingulata]|nr:hypothetical protein OH77DRAFT_1427959 [Trametes cingulata]